MFVIQILTKDRILLGADYHVDYWKNGDAAHIVSLGCIFFTLSYTWKIKARVSDPQNL